MYHTLDDLAHMIYLLLFSPHSFFSNGVPVQLISSITIMTNQCLTGSSLAKLLSSLFLSKNLKAKNMTKNCLGAGTSFPAK